jgi:PAS domain S-box-containing protein
MTKKKGSKPKKVKSQFDEKGELKLTDLIPLEELQKIQDNWSNLTGISTEIERPDGTRITKQSMASNLCWRYVRGTKKGCERCLKNDRELMELTRGATKPLVRHCKSYSHLLESAWPIIIEGKHIASVVCGEWLEESPGIEKYKKTARELGVDEEGFIEALKQIPIIPKEKYMDAIELLHQIALTLSDLGYQRLKEQRIKKEVEHAVDFCGDVLNRIVYKGDLSARVDTGRLTGKHKKIGEDINKLIGAMQGNMKELQRHKEEISRTNAYLESVLETIAAPVWILDEKGRVTYVNPAFEQILGYKKKECVDNTLQEFLSKIVPESDVPVRIGEFKKRMVSGKVSRQIPQNMIAKDGKEIPTITSAAPIRAIRGNIIGEVVSGIDVSELKSKEEYISSLLYSIPDPTSILDLSGTRIYSSKSVENAFKLPREKVLGSKVEVLYDKKDWKKIRETMEKGKHGYASCEAYRIRGDGKTIPAILSFAPVKNKDGNLINIAFSATDITELKNKEKELKNAILSFGKVLSRATKGDLSARVNLDDIVDEYDPIAENINSMILATQKNITELRKREAEIKEARAYAEAIIANLADPLWVTDKNDNWVLINQAMENVTGYTKEELVGKKMSEQPMFEFFLSVPGSKEKLETTVEKIKDGERIPGIMIPWLTKDKRIFMMSCSGEPLKDAEGKIIGGVFIGKDMATLQRAGIAATKVLNKKVEEKLGKDYELATTMFISNAALIVGDSSLEILRGVVDGYNQRFGKSIGIEDGIAPINLPDKEYPSFVEFLLSTFYECIGPTSFECSEGIKSIGGIVEKVKTKYEGAGKAL